MSVEYKSRNMVASLVGEPQLPLPVSPGYAF